MPEPDPPPKTARVVSRESSPWVHTPEGRSAWRYVATTWCCDRPAAPVDRPEEDHIPGGCGHTWREVQRVKVKGRKRPPALLRPVESLTRTEVAPNQWILGCDTRHAAYGCPVDGCAGEVHQDSGCHGSKCICAECKAHRGRERASRVWDQLQLAGGRITWGVVVLTCPPEVRLALAKRQRVDGLRRAASRVFQGWAKQWLFPGKVVDVGAVLVVHPTGDNPSQEWKDAFAAAERNGEIPAPHEDDTGTWAPHVNIIFPLTGWAGRWMRRTQGYLPGALPDLKRRWSEEMAAHRWGWEGGPVNAFYEFVPVEVTAARQAHLLRYMMRPFTRWDPRVGWVTYSGYMLPCRVASVVPDPDRCEPWPVDPDAGKCPCCGERFRLHDTGPDGCRKPAWTVVRLEGRGFQPPKRRKSSGGA